MFMRIRSNTITIVIMVLILITIILALSICRIVFVLMIMSISRILRRVIMFWMMALSRVSIRVTSLIRRNTVIMGAMVFMSAIAILTIIINRIMFRATPIMFMMRSACVNTIRIRHIRLLKMHRFLITLIRSICFITIHRISNDNAISNGTTSLSSSISITSVTTLTRRMIRSVVVLVHSMCIDPTISRRQILLVVARISRSIRVLSISRRNSSSRGVALVRTRLRIMSRSGHMMIIIILCL